MFWAHCLEIKKTTFIFTETNAVFSPCSVFTFRNCQIISHFYKSRWHSVMKLPYSHEGVNPESYVMRTLAPHPGVGCLPVLHSLGKGIKIIWTIGCDPSLGYKTTCRQHSGRATLLPFRDPGKLNFTCTWTSKRFKIAGISNFIRTCLRATQVQTCLGFCAIYRDPESSWVPWRVFVLSS